jgi:hypothetical protein
MRRSADEAATGRDGTAACDQERGAEARPLSPWAVAVLRRLTLQDAPLDDLPDPLDAWWRDAQPPQPDRFLVTEHRAVGWGLAVPLYHAMRRSRPSLLPPAHACEFPGLTVPPPLRLVVDGDGWYRVILRWPRTGAVYTSHVRRAWASQRAAVSRWPQVDDESLRRELAWLWNHRAAGWSSNAWCDELAARPRYSDEWRLEQAELEAELTPRQRAVLVAISEVVARERAAGLAPDWPRSRRDRP